MSLDDSFNATQDLLKAHSDLKGVVGFGSHGPNPATHVLLRQWLVGKVAVVGTVLPKQAAPYFKDAALNAGFLRDPKDESYAAVAVVKKVLERKPIDSSLELPGLGEHNVHQATKQIKFDQIEIFNADNATSIVI